MLKVSVIVPVYNPGKNIGDCIKSLRRQSLPPEEYEVIFVDDGSTDRTPARLDKLAASQPNMRVEHIPNSGWPGRPRNVGLDMAGGEFVYFVDNDDWLGREALERLYATAVENEADVVVGKVVGHGKAVARSLFRESREDVKLDWPPLLRLLTPHKLFRKALLEEHGIRFPEGRRRLEDHVFVVHAYFHARRISVLADYPCYHWMLRSWKKNASAQRFDPVGYFHNLREVLDIVDAHTEPGPLRDQLYAHWYRSKLLTRVGGGPFTRRDPPYRRQIYEEVHRLALERYGREVDAYLPFQMRVRSRLLREGSYESLGTLAEFETQLCAQVTVRKVLWEEDVLVLELEAELSGKKDPLHFVRRGSRILWSPPSALRGELDEEVLDATEELSKSRVEVVLRSTRDRREYVVPARSELVLLRADGDGDQKRPFLNAVARVDPSDAAAGSPLGAGEWEVHADVYAAGFTAGASADVPAGRHDPRPSRRGGRTPLALTSTAEGKLRRRRGSGARDRDPGRVPWRPRRAAGLLKRRVLALVKRGRASGGARGAA